MFTPTPSSPAPLRGIMGKVKGALGIGSGDANAAAAGAGGATPGAGEDSSKQLNATLASLSKAITNLPMSIATMELTVSPSRG